MRLTIPEHLAELIGFTGLALAALTMFTLTDPWYPAAALVAGRLLATPEGDPVDQHESIRADA